MKRIVICLLFTPLAALCIASVQELRSHTTVANGLWRLAAPVVGIAVFVLFWVDLGVTLRTFTVASAAMVVLAAIIASSGVFVGYCRPSTSRHVAFGGLILAIMWLWNRRLY